ncbi:conserved hypothetical protein [Novosphingobium sp. 9U]|nr:conserved hypothetical protein [Novosphingobium sp. 9U]
MVFRKTRENTAVTLPLDVVLELIKGTRGEPVSFGTMALLQVDVGHAICSLPVEPEVAESIFRETFGCEVS